MRTSLALIGSIALTCLFARSAAEAAEWTGRGYALCVRIDETRTWGRHNVCRSDTRLIADNPFGPIECGHAAEDRVDFVSREEAADRRPGTARRTSGAFGDSAP